MPRTAGSRNRTKPGPLPPSLIDEMDSYARKLVEMGKQPEKMTVSEKIDIFGIVSKWVAIRAKVGDEDEEGSLINELRSQFKGKDHKREKRGRVDAVLTRAAATGIDQFKREFLPGDDGDDERNSSRNIDAPDPLAGNHRGLRSGLAGNGRSQLDKDGNDGGL